MRIRNIFSWGLLCLCITCLFVGSAQANTLFSIDSLLNASESASVVRAYTIEGNAITNPVTFSEEIGEGDGPVGIAVSEDLGLIFITYEDSSIVTVFKSRTLQKVTEVDTLVFNLAGIVADDVKDKIYIIRRNTNYLYAYTWNETTKDLDLVGDEPHELSDLPNKGMGIALVGDYLYVTDASKTVRCYNTTTWAHETYYDITFPSIFYAFGIAIYNDGAGNRFGYFGGWAHNNRFIKVDLDNTANQTTITPSGYGVTGIATDPDTGFVYASVRDFTNRVFDTSFNEVYSVETGINPADHGPAGMAVGRGQLQYIPPFQPNKADNIADCVPPRDGQITYTINYDYQWNDANDPNPEDFNSIIIVDELSLGVDFVEQSSDPCWVYHEDGHYVTYDVEPDFWDDPCNIELAVQVNRKVPPAGKIENTVKVKAYINNQEHIGSAKIETDVCDCTGYGKVIYVDIDADPGGDGTGWDKAFRKLQEGLAESWPCDEIWVAKSENAYKPTDDPYDVKATFSLVSGVGVYGGFLGGEAGEEHRYERNWFDNETVINGDINGSAKVEYVVTSDANAPVSVLDGFTIKNGSIAGVYCENSSPIIQHNKITASGSGIYCSASIEPVIKNSWIYKNYNGIYFNEPGDTPIVRNNTIAYNTYYGLSASDINPNISMTNCILWGNGTQLNLEIVPTYSCIEDWIEGGTGNISSDPCFVNAGTENYLLKSISACIDAGDPDGNYGGQRDIDKQFRVLDGGVNGKIVDMGADEYCNETENNEADFSGDGIVNYLDFAIFAGAWLSENDPCDERWNGSCDLVADNIIDIDDLNAFAVQWLWMTCDKMQGYEMMEMMMGAGAGESMLLAETAPVEAAAQSQVEPSVSEQIEQIKYFLDWLYEIKDQVDEDTWLNLTASLEEMLKELQQE